MTARLTDVLSDNPDATGAGPKRGLECTTPPNSTAWASLLVAASVFLVLAAEERAEASTQRCAGSIKFTDCSTPPPGHVWSSNSRPTFTAICEGCALPSNDAGASCVTFYPQGGVGFVLKLRVGGETYGGQYFEEVGIMCGDERPDFSAPARLFRYTGPLVPGLLHEITYPGAIRHGSSEPYTVRFMVGPEVDGGTDARDAGDVAASADAAAPDVADVSANSDGAARDAGDVPASSDGVAPDPGRDGPDVSGVAPDAGSDPRSAGGVAADAEGIAPPTPRDSARAGQQGCSCTTGGRPDGALVSLLVLVTFLVARTRRAVARRLPKGTQGLRLTVSAPGGRSPRCRSRSRWC